MLKAIVIIGVTYFIAFWAAGAFDVAHDAIKTHQGQQREYLRKMT